MSHDEFLKLLLFLFGLFTGVVIYVVVGELKFRLFYWLESRAERKRRYRRR